MNLPARASTDHQHRRIAAGFLGVELDERIAGGQVLQRDADDVITRRLLGLEIRGNIERVLGCGDVWDPNKFILCSTCGLTSA
jgi:hypothetical protein